MKDKKRLNVDLHVHSYYSERPSQWILKTIGTRESYTDPYLIYKTSKELGMDLVTITDHNKIDGIVKLNSKYPDDTFLGVEATSYFPEDGCKIHVLLYGFEEKQFEDINRLRANIYDLRDYIKENNLAHSVAHATFSINGRLKVDHLEKLILMFDVFEGVNGGRSQNHNDIWMNALQHLNPDHIDTFYKKHKIEPMSKTAWKKGFTGGSDDHGGLFIGKTYTQAAATDVPSFIEALKNKDSKAYGRHNDFHALAFTIYKVGYDFTKDKGVKLSNQLIQNLNELLLDKRAPSLKDRFYFKKLKKKDTRIKEILVNLIEDNIQKSNVPIEDKIDSIYNNIADLTDDFFSATLKSVIKSFGKMDWIDMFRKASSSLVGILVSLPFLTSLSVMYQDRKILNQIEDEIVPSRKNGSKRVLWFTDTIADLNGVSMTLKKIGWLALNENKKLTLVSSLLENEKNEELPPNLELLPTIYNVVPDFYDSYNIKIPSLLKSIKRIYELNPEEIIISTPGPVGLLGLLCARLLCVNCKTIYHTDFTREFEKILGDGTEVDIVETYMRWFFHQGDEIWVPTKEYIEILEARDFDRMKMKIFRRGIDLNQYHFKDTGKNFIRDFFSLKEDAIVLLYTGRVSKDKSIDFLFDVFEKLREENDRLVLVIAGDGPEYIEYKKRYQSDEAIKLPGRISQKIMPYLYSGSDIFMFPSTTDTFGMSVLEAQACGLPAIVTDVGGPKEIIIDQKTGFALPAGNLEEWLKVSSKVIHSIAGKEKSYAELCENAQKLVKEQYDWSKLLDNLFN